MNIGARVSSKPPQGAGGCDLDAVKNLEESRNEQELRCQRGDGRIRDEPCRDRGARAHESDGENRHDQHQSFPRPQNDREIASFLSCSPSLSDPDADGLGKAQWYHERRGRASDRDLMRGEGSRPQPTHHQ